MSDMPPVIRFERGRSAGYKPVNKAVTSKSVVTDIHGTELATVEVCVSDDNTIVVQMDVYPAGHQHDVRVCLGDGTLFDSKNPGDH